MRYGFYLPTRGELGEPDALARLVREAEALGFASVVIADHIVFPAAIRSAYPYTVDGHFPGQGDALEQLTLMAYLAGISGRLRLVTSVMILPHRNPLATAKVLASIDVLSKGRVTVGVGVGWMREEFRALGAPDFDRRGRVSDEYLAIFKACWTQDPASYQGAFYSFDDVHCLPHPVQKPHPPIWIGGHSKAALRRTAKYGDGWHPVAATAATPLPPPEFRGLLDELKRLTEAEGRDFGALTIAMKAPSYDPGTVPAGQERLMFTGEPARIADDIRAYAALGVDEIIFDFRAPPLSRALARMEEFIKEVAPLAA